MGHYKSKYDDLIDEYKQLEIKMERILKEKKRRKRGNKIRVILFYILGFASPFLMLSPYPLLGGISLTIAFLIVLYDIEVYDPYYDMHISSDEYKKTK
jgi:hypothetical protein